MKKMNVNKYQKYQIMDFKNRTWPNKTITKAPIWCSVDLRDGNQALSIPMNLDEKMMMFEFLVSMGFKEIELGFPSASEVEFQFVRRLIEEKKIPKDVTVQVLTQARRHLLERTFESLEGVDNAIVHLYNSTSTAQREIVFNKSKKEIMDIAIEGTKIVKELKEKAKNPNIRLQYSPESFTGTEIDYALEVCHAVMDIWSPDKKNKIIFNLPATVEMSTPNVYADRIEWFSNNVKNRDCVIISVHAHNDRGTAVAAAELAVMAGAQKVEGALFGNGERCGNMDIITMALNLFSQGIDPELDFTDINKIREIYTKTTRMEVPPRHPYAGELVYTAFSGSHQDAINKGMKCYAKSKDKIWNVPYLPIDPKDVGRTYESIIRINSQSGKGGVAYIMENDFGILIPKWMQPDFGKLIQNVTDKTAKELSSLEINDVFKQSYLDTSGWAYKLKKCHIDADSIEVDVKQSKEDKAKQVKTNCIIDFKGKEISFNEYGNGPVDAFVKGLIRATGTRFVLENYSEHAVAKGADSKAIAYISIKTSAGKNIFGAGIDENITVASMKAVLSAFNRI